MRILVLGAWGIGGAGVLVAACRAVCFCLALSTYVKLVMGGKQDAAEGLARLVKALQVLGLGKGGLRGLHQWRRRHKAG